MERLKFSVGDTVTIKSKDWYMKNKDENGDIRFGFGKEPFVRGMDKFCGKTATIINMCTKEYVLDIDRGYYYWNDEHLSD
jgi:hypothetical protein